MFCPECGYKIEEEDARFCPECGTMVGEDVPDKMQERCADFVDMGDGDILGDAVDGLKEFGNKIFDAFGDVAAKTMVKATTKFVSGLLSREKHIAGLMVPRDASIHLYGIIFTNIKLLALKFDVTENTINGLLEDFITQKQKSGVYYHLINVDNYAFLNESKTVHLDSSCKEPWNYMEILNDFQNYAEDHSMPEFRYLFIIGGDDIIPMPRIRHYMSFQQNYSDKDIETDMLYAYPYNKDMVSRMESQEIFNYDQLFHVGRLPMGTDTSLNDFIGYLNRCIVCSEKGIPMLKAYIQCDPNWKRMTATAARKVAEGSWLRNLGQLPSDKYFQGLILSPEFLYSDVAQVFDKEASLYFFNLHGSKHWDGRGYSGKPFPQKNDIPCRTVILPEHLTLCQKSNVVLAGACYGARFIGKDKLHSMLLASIYQSTLLFVGSSRMAMGYFEPLHTDAKYVKTKWGDKMAEGFLNALMAGHTAGEALFKGRDLAFRCKTKVGNMDDGIKGEASIRYYATTIVEFNLFGDPTLRMDVPDTTVSADRVCTRGTFGVDDTYKPGCVMEEVELPDCSSAVSILNMVRQKVNKNIATVHDIVGRQLYLQYGIEPRPASSIIQLTYPDGTREFNFSYAIDKDSLYPIQYFVETTEKGKIISVATTK